VRLLPELADCGWVWRPSTSSGLSLNGVPFNRAGGEHTYPLIKDASDAKRVLDILFDRAWLDGKGWIMLGRDGKMLERSIVDRIVYGAERLIFEGEPAVVPPLQQDIEARTPEWQEGPAIDTHAVVQPLTPTEAAQVATLIAAATVQPPLQASGSGRSSSRS
jgi:hypothetical protein